MTPISTDSDDALAKETLRDEVTEVKNIDADPIRWQSQELKACLEALGLSLEGDGYVKWRPDARTHPRNWSVKRKIYDTGLIILLDLVTTAISSAGPSVAEQAKEELGLSPSIALLGFASMYQFGQAIGGIAFPPYSETFGRKPVYIWSSICYSISCLILGAVPSVAGAFVGRFISGIMSAVPSIIVEGSIEDMFNMKRRIWIVLLWACATTAGLVIGPIYGSYISAALGWRWVFYISAIAVAAFSLLLLLIAESRPSKLLAIQVSRLHQQTGVLFPFRDHDSTPNFATFCQVALIRPVRLFFTEPIVFLVSLISAISWSLIYFFTESLPLVYSSFGFTTPTTSLAFLPLLVGIIFSTLPRLHDQKVLTQKKQQSQPVHPEDKLLGFAVAAPALSIGLWIFAWTTPPASHPHWSVSMLGLTLIGFATNEFACTLSGYLADSYTTYASSAFAALAFLRAVLAGVFPLFARPMYEDLGANRASSVLAAIATVFCVAPVLFRRFGRRLRLRSPFARYSMQVHREMQVEDDNVE